MPFACMLKAVDGSLEHDIENETETDGQTGRQAGRRQASKQTDRQYTSGLSEHIVVVVHGVLGFDIRT